MDKENVAYIRGVICFSHHEAKSQPSMTGWMKLEGIMLSNMSYTQRDKQCMVSLIRGN